VFRGKVSIESPVLPERKLCSSPTAVSPVFEPDGPRETMKLGQVPVVQVSVEATHREPVVVPEERKPVDPELWERFRRGVRKLIRANQFQRALTEAGC